MSSDTHIDHIHLLGNPDENFYALGRKDQEHFSEIFDLVSKLCTRSDGLAKVFKVAIDASSIFNPKKEGDYGRYLNHYAQGLERPVNDAYFLMLMPEIVAAFNKWVPDLLGLIPGCSSLFTWDEKNQGSIHARLLDYAIGGIFEKHERSILYELTNQNAIFSYGLAGMPFASVSGMNDQGLTLALHYKHGNYFDLNGHSIFVLADKILKECGNIHQVKKLLRFHPTISYWGIYLSDKNGDVASIDVCGKDIFIEKFDLKEHKYLYFNNRPLLTNQKDANLRPYGNLEQCKMRFHSIKEKLTNFDFAQKDLDLNLLKVLSTPQAHLAKHARNWKLDTLTPSTIQALSFHTKTFESYYIPGPTPKIFGEQVIHYQKIFSGLEEQIIKTQTNTPKKFSEGLRRMSLAQTLFDAGRIEESYHHIQMAVIYFKGYPETYIAKFYFCTWQYIYEKNQQDMEYLYNDFLSLANKLPTYLEDHRLLFLMRLGKLLGHAPQDLSAKIKTSQIKKQYHQEMKLNSMAIKLMSRMIVPRLEIADVLHP